MTVNESEATVWTLPDIEGDASNWTLSSDVQMLRFLETFSEDLMSQLHNTTRTLEELVCFTEEVSTKVNNTFNDFNMLSNVQFIESRVYEDDETKGTKPTELPEVPTEDSADVIGGRIKTSVEFGLTVLDAAYDFHTVDGLDEYEDVNEAELVMRSKDPYSDRSLPFLIGSSEYCQEDSVGIAAKFLSDDEESSKGGESSSEESEEEEEEEEGSTEQAQRPPPPQQNVWDDSDSETGSEETDVVRSRTSSRVSRNSRIRPSPGIFDEPPPTQRKKVFDSIFDSSSDEEEEPEAQSRDQPRDTGVSDEVPEGAAPPKTSRTKSINKYGGVSMLGGKTMFEGGSIKIVTQEEKDEEVDVDGQKDEPPKTTSTLPKTKISKPARGLFSSSEESEEEEEEVKRTKTLPKKVPAAGKSLFDSSTTTSSPSPEPRSATGNKSSKQIPDIFAESSDDDDSDLFGSKIKNIQEEAPQKSEVVTRTKPLFSESDDQEAPAAPSKPAKQKSNPARPAVPDDLFGSDSDDDEDMFGFTSSKKKEVPSKSDKKQSEIKPRAPSKLDDIFGSDGDDDDVTFFQPPKPKQNTETSAKKKMAMSIAEEMIKSKGLKNDEHFEQDRAGNVSTSTPKKGLFDSDDDDEDDDSIFGSKPAKPTQLPAKIKKVEPKPAKPVQTKGLFSSDEEDGIFSAAPRVEEKGEVKKVAIPKKQNMDDLFGSSDDDGDDLFGNKPKNKEKSQEDPSSSSISKLQKNLNLTPAMISGSPGPLSGKKQKSSSEEDTVSEDKAPILKDQDDNVFDKYGKPKTQLVKKSNDDDLFASSDDDNEDLLPSSDKKSKPSEPKQQEPIKLPPKIENNEAPKKKKKNFDDLFASDDEDDMFSSKPADKKPASNQSGSESSPQSNSVSELKKNLNLTQTMILGGKPPKKVTDKPKDDLFDNSDDEEDGFLFPGNKNEVKKNSSETQPPESQAAPKSRQPPENPLNDSDSDDIFNSRSAIKDIPKIEEDKPPKKKKNFDDLFADSDSDSDMFSGTQPTSVRTNIFDDVPTPRKLFPDTPPQTEPVPTEEPIVSSPKSKSPAGSNIAKLQNSLKFNPVMLMGGPPPKRGGSTSPAPRNPSSTNDSKVVDSPPKDTAVLSSVTKGRPKRGGRRPPSRTTPSQTKNPQISNTPPQAFYTPPQTAEEVKKEDRTVTKTPSDGMFEEDASTAMFDDIFSDIQPIKSKPKVVNLNEDEEPNQPSPDNKDQVPSSLIKDKTTKVFDLFDDEEEDDPFADATPPKKSQVHKNDDLFSNSTEDLFGTEESNTGQDIMEDEDLFSTPMSSSSKMKKDKVDDIFSSPTTSTPNKGAPEEEDGLFSSSKSSSKVEPRKLPSGDEDDDLFSVPKTSKSPKNKQKKPKNEDIFDDDFDLFSGASSSNSSKKKRGKKTGKTKTGPKKTQDFDDPLFG